ncbi:Fic family protein [Patescibacteria group bacterium]|nr:Fic family protein [Patescibacteria group bacterium]
MISSSINAIHLFEDGNGRTSRLFYTLLTENYSEIKYNRYLSEILGEFGREKIDINPVIVSGKIEDIMREDILRECGEEYAWLGTTRYSEDLFKQAITEVEKKEFKKLESDNSSIFSFSLYNQISSRENSDKYKKKSYNSNGKLTRIRILLDELLPDLDNEDIGGISGDYWKLKKRYVEILIDAIVNPERYKTTDNNDQDITIKEFFEHEIDRKVEVNLEKERRKQEEEEIKREQEEKAKIQEKEAENKLDNGEGSYEVLSIDEIKEIILIKNKLNELVNQKIVDEYNELEKQEKIKQFSELLVKTATNINEGLILTNEQAERYVIEKGDSFLEHYYKYRQLNEIIEYLDGLNLWDTKFTTSVNIIESLDSKALSDSEVDSFLSQSIYYVTKKGQSIRLKLFELERQDVKKVIQSFMERIFYSDEMIDYREKSVAKCEHGVIPAIRKYVFEIASQEFSSLLEKDSDDIAFDYRSNIKTIDEDGVYVQIPSKALLHTGCAISSIEKSIKS